MDFSEKLTLFNLGAAVVLLVLVVGGVDDLQFYVAIHAVVGWFCNAMSEKELRDIENK